MQRTKTIDQVAYNLRIHPRSILRSFKEDWSDMPREEIKSVRGTKEYRFNIEEVIKYLEVKFN